MEGGRGCGGGGDGGGVLPLKERDDSDLPPYLLIPFLQLWKGRKKGWGLETEDGRGRGGDWGWGWERDAAGTGKRDRKNTAFGGVDQFPK